MKHATRPRRIVAALVALAMVLSLCMPVLAESGAAQQTDLTEGSTTEPERYDYPYLILNYWDKITPEVQEIDGISVQYQDGTYTLSVNDPEGVTEFQGVASKDGVLPNVVLKGETRNLHMQDMNDVQLTLNANYVYLLEMQDVTVTDSAIKRLHARQTPTASINSLTMTGSSANVVYAGCVQDVRISDFKAAIDDTEKEMQLASENSNVTLALADDTQINAEMKIETPKGSIEFSGSSSGNLLADGHALRAETRQLHAVNNGSGKIGQVYFLADKYSLYDIVADGKRLSMEPGSSVYTVPAEQSGKELTIEYAGPDLDHPPQYDYPYLIVNTWDKITPDDNGKVVEGISVQYQADTHTYILSMSDSEWERSIVGAANTDGVLPNVVLENTTYHIVRMQKLQDVTVINSTIEYLYADYTEPASINSFKMTDSTMNVLDVRCTQEISVPDFKTAAGDQKRVSLTSDNGNVEFMLADGVQADFGIRIEAPEGKAEFSGSSSGNLLIDDGALRIETKHLHVVNHGNGKIGQVYFWADKDSLYTITADGEPLQINRSDIMNINADQSGRELCIDYAGPAPDQPDPDPDPEPDKPPQYDYPYLMMDGGTITPENLDDYRGYVQYEELTHTYTLNFEGTPEEYFIPIEGVAAKDGTLPNVVLKNVNVAAVFLQNLDDVTINGTVGHLSAPAEEDSFYSFKASVNHITVNGTVRIGAVAFATGNIEITDGFATEKMGADTEGAYSTLGSAEGNISVNLRAGEQLQMGLVASAPNGEVHITGDTAGLLTAEGVEEIDVYANALYAENKTEDGGISRVFFTAFQPGDYTATADGKVMDVTWGTFEDTGYVKCDIPADKTSSKLTIECTKELTKPYLLLRKELEEDADIVAITPDNVEQLFGAGSGYEDVTATYTLNVDGSEMQVISLQGVAYENQLPNVVLNVENEPDIVVMEKLGDVTLNGDVKVGVSLSELRDATLNGNVEKQGVGLNDLRNVTLNGTFGTVVAIPEGDSIEEPGEPVVNRFTLNGEIRSAAFVFAREDIEIQGTVAAEKFEQEYIPIVFYSYEGDVTVAMDAGKQAVYPLTFYALNGGVWVTGDTTEPLLAQDADIEVRANSLYAANKSGKVGEVLFSADADDYAVTVDGQTLGVEWKQETPGLYNGCGYIIAADDSGSTLTVAPKGSNVPESAAPKLRMTMADGTEQVLSPAMLETYKGLITYDEETATYVFHFGRDDVEGYDAFCNGVSTLQLQGIEANGVLPNVKIDGAFTFEMLGLQNLGDAQLNCSVKNNLYLEALGDVTVNGNVGAVLGNSMLAFAGQKADVNSLTVNGKVRYTAYIATEQDLVINGSFAAEKTLLDDNGFLGSLHGNVKLTTDAPVQLGGMSINAPNGSVTITGTSSESLMADSEAEIILFAQKLYATNPGGLGKMYLCMPRDAYDAIADGSPLKDLTWEEDAENNVIRCKISAEQAGSSLTVEPRITDPTDPAQPDETGSGVLAAVVGVAAGGAVIWGGYELATRVILHNLLPEGTAIPATRAELVKLAWETAGKPEPAAQPAFADITDPELAKAAQWCVEQGMLDAQDGSFRPEDHIAKFRVIEAWKKVF